MENLGQCKTENVKRKTENWKREMENGGGAVVSSRWSAASRVGKEPNADDA